MYILFYREMPRKYPSLVRLFTANRIMGGVQWIQKIRHTHCERHRITKAITRIYLCEGAKGDTSMMPGNACVFYFDKSLFWKKKCSPWKTPMFILKVRGKRGGVRDESYTVIYAIRCFSLYERFVLKISTSYSALITSFSKSNIRKYIIVDYTNRRIVMGL